MGSETLSAEELQFFDNRLEETKKRADLQAKLVYLKASLVTGGVAPKKKSKTSTDAKESTDELTLQSLYKKYPKDFVLVFAFFDRPDVILAAFKALNSPDHNGAESDRQSTSAAEATSPALDLKDNPWLKEFGQFLYSFTHHIVDPKQPEATGNNRNAGNDNCPVATNDNDSSQFLNYLRSHFEALETKGSWWLSRENLASSLKQLNQPQRSHLVLVLGVMAVVAFFLLPVFQAAAATAVGYLILSGLIYLAEQVIRPTRTGDKAQAGQALQGWRTIAAEDSGSIHSYFFKSDNGEVETDSAPGCLGALFGFS